MAKAQPTISADNSGQNFSRQSTVVNLRDYGFRQAGKHHGDVHALGNLLENIRTGHLLDEQMLQRSQNQQHQQTDNEINRLKQEINRTEADRSDITANRIPKIQSKIADLESQNSNLEIERAEAIEKSRESRFNYLMYLIFFVPATLFVYLFYVMATHSALLRDIAGEVAKADARSIQSVLNTVFNIKAFGDINFHWVAPVVFFIFAALLHRIFDSKSKYRVLHIVMVLLFVLCADGLIAYFIEANSHLVKTLTGLAKSDQPWHFYLSPVFYMVLVFGFFSCLGWSALLYALREEKLKSIPEYVILAKRKMIAGELKELNDILEKLTADAGRKEAEIKNLQLSIDQLENQKQKIVFSPLEIAQSITAFFDGWLAYVNGIDHNNDVKQKCLETVTHFARQYDLKIDLSGPEATQPRYEPLKPVVL